MERGNRGRQQEKRGGYVSRTLSSSELTIGDKLKVAFRVFGPNQTLQTGGIMAKRQRIYSSSSPHYSVFRLN